MARAKELAQRCQTTLSVTILLARMVGWEQGLVCIHTDRHNDTFSMPASLHALHVCPGAPFVLLGAGLAPL